MKVDVLLAFGSAAHLAADFMALFLFHARKIFIK